VSERTRNLIILLHGILKILWEFHLIVYWLTATVVTATAAALFDLKVNCNLHLTEVEIKLDCTHFIEEYIHALNIELDPSLDETKSVSYLFTT
jgi:hypothetical protein